MQTSSASIYAMVISIIVLTTLMIVCLGVFYIKKRNAVLLFLIGTLGYLIPQICIRYPLISFFQISIFPLLDIGLVIFVLSFTTALFETIGRFLVVKFGLKQEVNKFSGIMIGLGHGCCEALFLLAITYINNLFIIYLAQLGGDSNQINLVLSAIDNVPLTLFYFTLLERLLYIAIQTGISSFMINQIVSNKKWTFFFIFILHLVIDLLITSLSVYGMQIEVLDCIIAFLALLSVVYIWKSYHAKTIINGKDTYENQVIQDSENTRKEEMSIDSFIEIVAEQNNTDENKDKEDEI